MVRDELVANVCSAIRLPLLTVPAKAAYSVSEVRKQFLATVGDLQGRPDIRPRQQCAPSG